MGARCVRLDSIIVDGVVDTECVYYSTYGPALDALLVGRQVLYLLQAGFRRGSTARTNTNRPAGRKEEAASCVVPRAMRFFSGSACVFFFLSDLMQSGLGLLLSELSDCHVVLRR